MRLAFLKPVVVLLLAACGKSDPLPAAPAPSPVPAPTPVHTSVLQSIDFVHGVRLLRYEDHITVTEAGTLCRLLTRHKSYGPQDAAPGPVLVFERQLSAAEITELAGLFNGWDKLETSYPTVADGPQYTITYGSKVVRGEKLPASVLAVAKKIEALADSAPKVDEYTPQQLEPGEVSAEPGATPAKVELPPQ